MAEPTPPPVAVNFLILDFADGEYEFRLPVEQIAELQTKCGAGIGALFARLMAGRYRNAQGDIVLQPLDALFKFEDVCETIRLALIGGGRGVVNGEEFRVGPIEALKLVKNYVHTRPLLEGWKIAAAVLSAFIVGYDEQKPQKKSATKTAKAKAGSTSEGASPTAQE